MRLTSLLVAVLWMRAAALVLYRSPSLRRGMASATKRPLTAMLDGVQSHELSVWSRRQGPINTIP